MDKFHNHKRDLAIIFPTNRVLPQGNLDWVTQLNDTNIQMYDILDSVRQSFPQQLVVQHQINNITEIHQAQVQAGPNATASIVKKMLEDGLPHRAWYNDNKQLTMLMVTSVTALEMARKWSSVFVMDCTYKTNGHKLPLLQIVGVASTNQTFLAATFHLFQEMEDFYTKALEAF